MEKTKEAEEAKVKNPASFLRQIQSKPVAVRLVDNTEYHGTLVCLDGCLNIAIEHCKEVRDGKVVNDYGDAFLRGNNVLYLCETPQVKHTSYS